MGPGGLEADAASRASSWLASTTPCCLEVLAERAERLEGSRHHAIEVAACTAIGDLQQGAEVLELGCAAPSAAATGPPSWSCSSGASGCGRSRATAPAWSTRPGRRSLTDVTGQRARGIQALTDAAAALSGLGRDDEAATLNAEISRRFASFDRSDMRSRPELVRQVLHTAGTTESEVLLHAAEVGDLAHERDSVFVEDSFALRRLLQQTSSDAGPALAALADEVGLDQKGVEGRGPGQPRGEARPDRQGRRRRPRLRRRRRRRPAAGRRQPGPPHRPPDVLGGCRALRLPRRRDPAGGAAGRSSWASPARANWPPQLGHPGRVHRLGHAGQRPWPG